MIVLNAQITRSIPGRLLLRCFKNNAIDNQSALITHKFLNKSAGKNDPKMKRKKEAKKEKKIGMGYRPMFF
jgi:hypothetical protein